jgi:hypothetical protein
MKQCSRCNATKPETEFHCNAAAYDGRQPHCKACDRKSYARNRDKILSRNSAYKKARYQNDPAYRIRARLSSELSQLLRHPKKTFKQVKKYSGMTAAELVLHFETCFLPGMTWENYAEAWEIDHIIPVAAFDHLDQKSIEACWHYSNLRPVWRIDNVLKRDMLPSGKRARRAQRVATA